MERIKCICGTQIKKTYLKKHITTKKHLEFIKKNSNRNFYDIPDELVNEILTFLTISENYTMLFVVKDININWSLLQDRDFKKLSNCLKLPLSKENSLKLEFGFIKIDESLNELITKTRAKNEFLLTDKDCDKLEVIKYVDNPHYRCAHSMVLYDTIEIQKLSAKKYNGLTNLFNELEKKKHKTEHKNIEKDKANKLFQIFINSLNNVYIYNGFSRVERYNLLYSKLSEIGMEIRDDSSLCNGFIYGTIKKHVEEVVALMLIAQLLFNRSHIFYSNYNDDMKKYVYEYKWKHQDMSWNDVVMFIYSSKFENKR
jgi:hypothetical protein